MWRNVNKTTTKFLANDKILNLFNILNNNILNTKFFIRVKQDEVFEPRAVRRTVVSQTALQQIKCRVMKVKHLRKPGNTNGAAKNNH